MIYLLKIKPKEDATRAAHISLSSEYKEFGRLTDLTKFVFDNSPYIESYLIYEMTPFEKLDAITACAGGSRGNITLDGGASVGIFN